MELVKTRIEIGLKEPFRALHISDNHISLADERDGDRKVRLAERRRAEFDRGTEATTRFLREQLDYAREQGLLLLHTGDLIDFVSRKNLDFARETLAGMDHFLAAGNHEYSLYVGEAFEDVPYKMQSYALVQSAFRYNLFFDSRVIHGVNFVAVDDGYYRFDRGQLARLQWEAEKGLPIVLMMHDPLHTDDLYAASLAAWGHTCAYLTGTPETLLAAYAPDRQIQQRPDEDTLAFIDYVGHQPLIKAILAGHVHFTYDTRLSSGIPQYVTGGGYRGCARELEFV